MKRVNITVLRNGHIVDDFRVFATEDEIGNYIADMESQGNDVKVDYLY